MEKVLVLGGGGFLGSHLVSVLAQNYEKTYKLGQSLKLIRVMDIRYPHIAELKALPSGVTIDIVEGDICDESALSQALDGIDTVFHCASIVAWSLYRNPLIDRVNIGATQSLLSLCKRHKIRNLIYTSTMDVVYTGNPISNGSAETCPYGYEINDYVRTKISAERLVIEANDGKSMKTCSLRPGHIYGERDAHTFRTVISTVRLGKLPFLLGNPSSAKFDCVYAGNIAHAHILAAKALHSSNSDKLAGKAYHISEGYHVNWWDFVQPYVEAKGLRLPVWWIPFWIVWLLALIMELTHMLIGHFIHFDPQLTRFNCNLLCRDFTFSSDRARRDFGYVPLFGRDEARKATLRWLIAQTDI